MGVRLGIRWRITGAALLLAAVWPPGPASGQEPPTFSRDVAPILHRHCISCHRAHAIGQFPLVTYTDARPWARAIRQQVTTRQMPPWKPVAGYGRFRDARVLSEEEIATLQRWVDGGAPEGDPDDAPPPPTLDEDGWQLGPPDLVVRLDESYTLPPGGEDVFRNFVLTTPLTETRYVRTVEIHPGAPETVHHAIMAVDDTASSRRRDAEDVPPGFEGMEMAQSFMPDGHLVGWTPGMSPFPGIATAPWRLDPGTDLVLQLHLLASDAPVRLRPEIGLYLADGPPTAPPMHLIRLDADHQLDIPAGETDFVVMDSLVLPVDVAVHSIYPHAHLIGKTVEGWATLPDGRREWLVKIDQWDFAWQDIYRVAEPVRLPAGSTIHMRFSYDNSSTNPRNPTIPPRRVTAGNGSSDEMAHLQLQVQLATASDRPRLEEALYRRAIARNPANPWSHRGLANILRDTGRTDEAVVAYDAALAVDPTHVPTHIDLGGVRYQMGRVDAALHHFREAIRLDPGSADGFYNLGTTLTLEGRSPEAVPYLEEAVRLEPGLAVAHTNLGQALTATGQLAAAVTHLELAVTLDPASAEARNNLGVTLARLGRLAEALQRFEQTLELDPQHASARANLELAAEIIAEQR